MQVLRSKAFLLSIVYDLLLVLYIILVVPGVKLIYNRYITVDPYKNMLDHSKQNKISRRFNQHRLVLYCIVNLSSCLPKTICERWRRVGKRHYQDNYNEEKDGGMNGPAAQSMATQGARMSIRELETFQVAIRGLTWLSLVRMIVALRILDCWRRCVVVSRNYDRLSCRPRSGDVSVLARKDVALRTAC